MIGVRIDFRIYFECDSPNAQLAEPASNARCATKIQNTNEVERTEHHPSKKVDGR